MDPKRLQALLDSQFDDEDYTPYFKCLLYGEPGAGKTKLAHTIGNKILTIAADSAGWESLKNHPELGLGTRIKLLRYRGLATLELVYEALNERVKGYEDYDTLIIDTANHISTLSLDRVTSIRIDKKGGIAEKASEVSSKFDFERDMFGVHNENTFKLRGQFLKLFDLPMNVIATAHATEREGNTKGKRDVTYPDLTPKVFASLNGSSSMVAFLTANTIQKKDNTVSYDRVLQVHPTYSVRAKTRIGGLPLTIRNPNLRAIVDDWQKSGGKLDKQVEIADENTKSDLEDFGLN